MVDRFLRNTITLVLCLGGQMVCASFKVVVVTANYLACLSAFMLLNFEMQPLSRDELIGWLFDSFVPDATLCHLYALGLALTQAMGLYFLFHYAFRCIPLYREHRYFLDRNEEINARDALNQIWMNLLFLIIVAIPLGFIIYWDVYLFRYRSVANMRGIEDGVQAATTLVNWDLQRQQYSHLFGWSLTHFGAWGYIGVTAMVCLGFEMTLMKTKDNWARWLDTVEEMFRREPAVPGQPAYANGYAGGGQPQFEAPAHPTPPAGRDEAPLFQPETPQGNPGPAADSQVPGPPESSAGPEHPSDTATADQVVIGGQAGERVSLEIALSQTDNYYVDPQTHEVWDRRYWEALFNNREAA